MPLLFLILFLNFSRTACFLITGSAIKDDETLKSSAFYLPLVLRQGPWY